MSFHCNAEVRQTVGCLREPALQRNKGYILPPHTMLKMTFMFPKLLVVTNLDPHGLSLGYRRTWEATSKAHWCREDVQSEYSAQCAFLS